MEDVGMAKAIKYDPSATSSSESEMLRQLDALLRTAEGVAVTAAHGRSVLLTDSFKQLLCIFVDAAAHNESLLIYSGPQGLSEQEAADLLNVSRPYVVKLIENGQLPARKVGPRRRVRFEDLMSFKHADDARRRGVARQLTAEAEEMGLGYVISPRKET